MDSGSPIAVVALKSLLIPAVLLIFFVFLLCLRRKKKVQEATFVLEADLNDPNSDLWKSPPRPDCPICMLPMPLKPIDSIYMQCCGNIICCGCDLKHDETIEENNAACHASASLKKTCAFCRAPVPSSTDEMLERLKKRMDLNDSEAFLGMVARILDSDVVQKDDGRKAFEYTLRAAELGNLDAYIMLSKYYSMGKLVKASKKKCKNYIQLAAMGGHVIARHELGLIEYKNGRKDLAARHWQIAAGTGLESSLKEVTNAYKEGLVSKDEFAKTLRAYQAAQEELNSDERNKNIMLSEQRVAARKTNAEKFLSQEQS